MLKIKNHFITFIIIGVFIIIGLGIFNSLFVSGSEKDTFVLLVEGKGMKNEDTLNINKKVLLEVGDTIKTMGNNSLAVIEWGDGSVTRLGGNSIVKIEDLSISNDLLDLKVSFKLLEGKTWSNIISFLGKDSYFKETFIVNNIDTTASVRGTIFDLDLDKNYLNVINHKVYISDTNQNSLTVDEFEPISLKTFDIIKYEDFILTFKDNTWNKINKAFDTQLFKNLKENLIKNLPELDDINTVYIQNLSDDGKRKLYNELLIKYQNLNFVNSNDKDLFNLKLNFKKQLINLADDENKNILVQNTLYDFKDSIINKNIADLDNIINILNQNKELLNNLDINSYFNKEELTNDVKNTLNSKLNSLKSIFKNTSEFKNIIDSNVNNIGSGLNNIGSNLNKIKSSLDKGIQNKLDESLGKYIK